MTERRPSNSELRLRRVTSEAPDPAPRGILELFDDARDESSDEDAPLAREAGETDSQ